MIWEYHLDHSTTVPTSFQFVQSDIFTFNLFFHKTVLNPLASEAPYTTMYCYHVCVCWWQLKPLASSLYTSKQSCWTTGTILLNLNVIKSVWHLKKYCTVLIIHGSYHSLCLNVLYSTFHKNWDMLDCELIVT